MKSILVSGGAGFIGSNLVRQILDNGDRAIVVDNFITSTGENLREFLGKPGFEFVLHDICDHFPEEQIGSMGQIDEIYHLACPTGVPNLLPMATEMLMTCSCGTENMLNLARKYNSRIVFTSSSEVYGNPKVFPQGEEYAGNVDPVGVRGSYEEGKRFAEAICMAYYRKYALDVKIVRIFNTYGRGSSEKETRVIPHFVRLAKRGEDLTVHGKGGQTRTFCHVDDLVRGLFLIAEIGQGGEVYNLGSDEEITIGALAKKIIKLTKSGSKIKHIARPSHDHNGRRPDLAKVKKLGWRLEVGLEQGLTKLL